MGELPDIPRSTYGDSILGSSIGRPGVNTAVQGGPRFKKPPLPLSQIDLPKTKALTKPTTAEHGSNKRMLDRITINAKELTERQNTV